MNVSEWIDTKGVITITVAALLGFIGGSSWKGLGALIGKHRAKKKARALVPVNASQEQLLLAIYHAPHRIAWTGETNADQRPVVEVDEKVYEHPSAINDIRHLVQRGQLTRQIINMTGTPSGNRLFHFYNFLPAGIDTARTLDG